MRQTAGRGTAAFPAAIPLGAASRPSAPATRKTYEFLVWSVLGGLFFGSSVGAAQDRDPATGPPNPAPPPARIEIRERAVRFASEAGDAPRAAALKEYEAAFLSARGDRCAIYDRSTGMGRTFNAHGLETARFQTEPPFACLLVSNAGLIAVFSPNTLHSGAMQEIRLYDAEGRELWKAADRFVNRGLVLEFSPDGQWLAILAPRLVDAHAYRPVAALFDRDGQRWAADLPIGCEVGDVAFDPHGRRLAFGVFQQRHLQHGGEIPTTNRFFVTDVDEPKFLEITCRDLGQPLARDALAFTADGRRLAVNGLARVQMYDAATGRQSWTTPLNAPQQTSDLLDTAAKIAVVRERVVAAHRISAPGGRVKYAVSILDGQGARLATQVVPEPQPRRADVGRFWDFSETGETVRLDLTPNPVTLRLP